VAFFFKDLLIYLREREGERTGMCKQGEGQREGEAQADSVLSEEPDARLNLTTLRSRLEPSSRVQLLTN